MEKDPLATNLLQPLRFSYDTYQVTYASFLLAPDELKLLESVFQQNKNVFAWTHSDIPRIHPSIASHRLKVILSSLPVH